ncbi:MAG: diadenylate cyclase [Nitrospirota bacterium]
MFDGGPGTSWAALVVAGLALVVVILAGVRSRRSGSHQIVIGLAVVAVGGAMAEWSGVWPEGWSAARWWSAVLFAALIILQPEIRKTLAAIGRFPWRRAADPDASPAVEEIVKAAVALANRRIGALIVIERTRELLDAVEVGTMLDARLSKELLLSVFVPYAPLHDGAVILRGGRIAAAGCFLPLSAHAAGVESYGTRHRAAIGITEETDALAIVVSEESGTIALVEAGQVARDLDAGALRQRLGEALGVDAAPVGRWARLARPRT